jgi:5'-nucleotidase
MTISAFERAFGNRITLRATGGNVPENQFQRIHLYHFSDYHGQLLPWHYPPFGLVGGLPRTITALQHIRRSPNALVFCGGDMLMAGDTFADYNRGIDIQWFNSLIDAMAFGNHDAVYGPSHFQTYAAELDFPILCANMSHTNGELALHERLVEYRIFHVGGYRIGVFALADSDFPSLMTPEQYPFAHATFVDPIACARRVVAQLRSVENADVVILIGHVGFEESCYIAEEVTGIDVIFGAHSHLQMPLQYIAKTRTVTISAYQHLAFLAHIELIFAHDNLYAIDGALLPVTETLAEEPSVARWVAQRQADMLAEPALQLYQVPFATLPEALSIMHLVERDTEMGNFIAEVMRTQVQSDIAMLTVNSIRAGLQAGNITDMQLRSVLPYPNDICLFELDGTILLALLHQAIRNHGTDMFIQVAGIRLRAEWGHLTSIVVGAQDIVRDLSDPVRAMRQRYRVTTTSYMAYTAPQYAPLFATGILLSRQVDLYTAVRTALTTTMHYTYRTDGRLTVRPTTHS